MYSLNIQAASFEKYAPKLLRFEGAGYGIDKAVWGDREFSKYEALGIHRKHYWDRFHGDLFKSQEMAEVLIDHLINAGTGKNRQNIKAFEAIIGAKQDGELSVEDVKRANSFYFPEQVVNAYVRYRVFYYKSRPQASQYPGWISRALSFLIGDKEIQDILLPTHLEEKFSHIELAIR